MSWPSVPLLSLSSPFRGFAQQWHAMFGTDVPELLRTVAVAGPGRGHWAVAMLHARAIAGSNARARALLGGFESELACVLGTQPLRWPHRIRAIGPASRPIHMPALDPSQQLLLAVGRASDVGHDHAAICCLLDAAFGPRDEPPHAAELRARVCSLAVTPAARERWRAGFGLMPPDTVAPGEHHGAMRLLQRAFGEGGGVRAVDATMCAPMPPEAALDVLLAGLAVRAGLRRAEVMCDPEATVTENETVIEQRAA